MDMKKLLELMEQVKAGTIDVAGAMKVANEAAKKDLPEPEFTYDRENDRVLLGGIKKGPKFGLSGIQWEKVREMCGLSESEGNVTYDPGKDSLGQLLVAVKNNSVPEDFLEPVKAESKKEATPETPTEAPAAK